MNKKLSFCLPVIVALISVCAVDVYATTSHIEVVTAISKVCGDGRKPAVVIIEYDTPILNSSLTNQSFIVEDASVKRIYANTQSDTASFGVDGRYVIIELNAVTDFNAQPRKAEPEDEAARAERDRLQGGPGLKAGWSTGGNDIYPGNAMVEQMADIMSVDGDIIRPDGHSYESTNHYCDVVDEYVHFDYYSPFTGQKLPCNIYIPSNYDSSKKYPLLLFIHDAGAVGDSIEQTLVQGRGAIAWASPEFQSRHECIVIAPQYPVVTVDDNWNYSHHLDATIELIKELQNQYSIDENRIYTTGQSMGCMSSIVMMLKEPDMFAGALLVAGKWNPELMKPLSQQNIWIISCEGDAHSNQLQSEAVALWRDNGAVVAEDTWDMELPLDEMSRKATAMMSDDVHLYFTHLRGGNHRVTWFVAYDIVAIQDWLFGQQRNH